MAYATIADVKARTSRSYTSEEEATIGTLLDDAAVMIDSLNTDASSSAKKIVSCRMVIRAMGDGAEGYSIPVGATQGSMAAGGYTQSWTMTGGATGEMYLGKEDRRLLGASNQIGSVSPVEELVPS